MRRLLIGDCKDENIFDLVDPTSFMEIEFEAEVVKALVCLMPEYWCGVFTGTFVLEGERRAADLALIHKSLSHWYVVEVELAGHSFEQHVLPQVRCFRYGEPDASCTTSLLTAFNQLTRKTAEALLRHIPRYVAVVANMADPQWSAHLRGADVQYLTVSVYRDKAGRSAHEIEGKLNAPTQSLGFARFSAIDNALRINLTCGLPVGQLQIVDQFGNPALWTAREGSGVLWISKDKGPALLDHQCYVQIIRTFDGRISLRPSAV